MVNPLPIQQKNILSVKFLKTQTVEFTQEDEYLRAPVYGVISKIYAKDFCEAFALSNKRAVSVEMTVVTPEDDEHKVL